MSVVAPRKMVEVGLVQEVVAVQIVEICCESDENSARNEAELDCKAERTPEFVVLGRVVLVHDEQGHEDDGVDAEVHPESKQRIGNVLLRFARLSLADSLFEPFNRTHVAVGIASEVEVPKGGSQGHRYSFATSPNGHVNQNRVETVEAARKDCRFVV